MGIRDERAKFSAGIVERIESALAKEFGDIYRTSDNYNTLTFEVGQFKDQDLYGSVKFTLHKPSYNLDDEIEIFEDFYAMREKQTAEKNKMKEAVKKQFYCFFSFNFEGENFFLKSQKELRVFREILCVLCEISFGKLKI